MGSNIFWANSLMIPLWYYGLTPHFVHGKWPPPSNTEIVLICESGTALLFEEPEKHVSGLSMKKLKVSTILEFSLVFCMCAQLIRNTSVLTNSQNKFPVDFGLFRQLLIETGTLNVIWVLRHCFFNYTRGDSCNDPSERWDPRSWVDQVDETGKYGLAGPILVTVSQESIRLYGTVDGRNSAPVDMVKILWFYRFLIWGPNNIVFKSPSFWFYKDSWFYSDNPGPQPRINTKESTFSWGLNRLILNTLFPLVSHVDC